MNATWLTELRGCVQVLYCICLCLKQENLLYIFENMHKNNWIGSQLEPLLNNSVPFLTFSTCEISAAGHKSFK